MKRLTASISLLIALLLAISATTLAAPTDTDNDISEEGDSLGQIVNDDNDDSEPLAATQDEDVSATAGASATSNLGTIYVGPSASGDAVRILRTGYALQPLASACLTCFGVGIVVGPADLDYQWEVQRLKAAYEAGQPVALTNATAASIRRLHDLIGHRGSAESTLGAAEVDLVAFRKAQRPDGRFNFRSHVLFPRVTASTSAILTDKDRKRLKRVSNSLRRKLRPKLTKQRALQRQQAADAADIQALHRIFSATPEQPPQPQLGGSPQQNIVQLAESYQSSTVQTDEYGNQVQIVNSVWDARSFRDSQDLYYVLQETDFHLWLISEPYYWNNTASSLPYEPNPTLIQPSPQSTMEATVDTSSTSYTIGGSVGWNETQGLDASVSASTTISNSKTTTIPGTTIVFDSNLATGKTVWQYYVNDRPHQTETITNYQGWIYEIPFSNYSGNQTEFQFNSWSQLYAKWHGGPPAQLLATYNASVPLPFGQTFALQSPVVTGVSPSCVDSGQEFTIRGTGMYPSLVQSVLIGGTPVAPANITTVSDTQINVIAPDTFACHGTGCSVAVQTTQGTSNTNFNITISDFCN